MERKSPQEAEAKIVPLRREALSEEVLTGVTIDQLEEVIERAFDKVISRERKRITDAVMALVPPEQLAAALAEPPPLPSEEELAADDDLQPPPSETSDKKASLRLIIADAIEVAIEERSLEIEDAATSAAKLALSGVEAATPVESVESSAVEPAVPVTRAAAHAPIAAPIVAISSAPGVQPENSAYESQREKSHTLLRVTAIGAAVASLGGVALIAYALFGTTPTQPAAESTIANETRVAVNSVQQSDDSPSGEKPKKYSFNVSADGEAHVLKPGETRHRGQANAFQGVATGTAEDHRDSDTIDTSSGRLITQERNLTETAIGTQRQITIDDDTLEDRRIPQAKRKQRQYPTRAITPQEVVKLQKASAQFFKQCYERAVKRNNSLRWLRMDVTLSIAGSGQIKKASFAGGNQDPELTQCLGQHIKRWTFQPIGEEADIVIPMSFRGQ